MNNTVKTAALLGLLSAVLMFIGQALGGGSGMAAGFFLAVVMNFGSYWFSDKIVLRMYRAQEVGPGHRLYDLVALLATHPNGLTGSEIHRALDDLLHRGAPDFRFHEQGLTRQPLATRTARR